MSMQSFQIWPMFKPFCLMMQASNETTFNIKVVDIFKTIKMDLNFASFGLLVKELWTLEVGIFCLSMHLVQKDL
jgi:hypothetical protein